MLYLLLVVTVFVLANGASIQNDKDAKILSNEYTIDEKGNYKFSYSTSNGINRQETGTLVNEGHPDAQILVYGQFSYTNPEGVEEIVKYIGDENGFRILSNGPEIPSVVYGLPQSAIASLLGK